MSDQSKRLQAQIITAVVVFLVVCTLLFWALTAIGRAREAACSSASARIMNALGKAMLMYADVPAFKKSYPMHLGDLYRDYVSDYRCFIRPGWEGQEAGYTCTFLAQRPMTNPIL